MGSARWDPTDWAAYAKSTSGRSTAGIFTRSALDPALDPKLCKVRESRDSAVNPASNAIIVGLDVTGSMGMIADALARRGLGVLVEELLARRPVTDPHVMVMGIGDAWCDRVPLQVTQFEADIRIARQLEQIYLEHGGGGNHFESYNLPWYFAATRTAIDCFEQRGRKGYLFTVGDELPPPVLLAAHARRVLGEGPQTDIATRDLLAMVERSYHVFHVVVAFCSGEPGFDALSGRKRPASLPDPGPCRADQKGRPHLPGPGGRGSAVCRRRPGSLGLPGGVRRSVYESDRGRWWSHQPGTDTVGSSVETPAPADQTVCRVDTKAYASAKAARPCCAAGAAFTNVREGSRVTTHHPAGGRP